MSKIQYVHVTKFEKQGDECTTYLQHYKTRINNFEWVFQ